MAYLTTRPIQGDNKIVLLKKLLQAWGGTIPNGPLHEREILRLLLTWVGVTVPSGPHTSEQLLALLLAAFQVNPAASGFIQFTPAITSLDKFDLSSVDTNFGIQTGELSFPTLVTYAGAIGNFSLQGSSGITSIVFPLLATTQNGSEFSVSDHEALTSVSFPKLTFVDGTLVLIQNPLLTSVGLPLFVSATSGLDFTDSPSLVTLSLPSLAFWFTGAFGAPPNITTLSLPALTGDASGKLFIDISSDMVGMVSLDLRSLVTATSDLTLAGLASLTSLNTAALATITGATDCSGCSSLVNFSATHWLPTNGTTILFTDCALNAASVNHIFSRCRAANVTTCEIDLSGGTNAAPTGQGLADKAALITAGNTVTTN